MATEYSPHGALSKFLFEKRGQFSTPKLVTMALDAAQGLIYLHSCNILHRFQT